MYCHGFEQCPLPYLGQKFLILVYCSRNSFTTVVNEFLTVAKQPSMASVLSSNEQDSPIVRCDYHKCSDCVM